MLLWRVLLKDMTSASPMHCAICLSCDAGEQEPDTVERSFISFILGFALLFRTVSSGLGRPFQVSCAAAFAVNAALVVGGLGEMQIYCIKSLGWWHAFCNAAYHSNNQNLRSISTKVIINDNKLRWENARQHTVKGTRVAMIDQTKNMQHLNLQQGLFANFNGKHFVGKVGRREEKSFLWKNILRRIVF